MPGKRPLADELEIRAPRFVALLARAVGRLPGPLRARVLEAAFERARAAFNRGDMEAVFALFSEDVEYGPPPPLHDGPPIRGRQAVFDLWREVRERLDTNAIENLSVNEATPRRIVRHARLSHHSSATGETLDYTIVQTTELERGRVVRQVNELAGIAPRDPRDHGAPRAYF